MPGEFAAANTEEGSKSDETSVSSLQDSEIEELIKTIDEESRLTDSVLNTSQDNSMLNHSFTEQAFKNP